jgi:hypothetical protein
MGLKPIPTWKRFPTTVSVERPAATGLGWETVIPALECRMWPIREQLVDGVLTTVSGVWRLLCDYDSAITAGDVAHSIREGDIVVEVHGDHRIEYTVLETADPANLMYNLQATLQIRGQTEV